MKRQFPMEISMPECPTTLSLFSPSAYVCKAGGEGKVLIAGSKRFSWWQKIKMS